jgi:putative ABC transport system permease protein
MRASFTVAWSEVRRRRLQSVVIVVMVALASGTITLGLNLLQEATSPYDQAFDAQKGAHLKVFYDARHVTTSQLASTPGTIGASASAGPWPNVYVTLLDRKSPNGESRHQLDLVGRASPEGPVELLRMTSGRWVQAPGEIVVTRAFAQSNRIGLGDHLVSNHTGDKPLLTVVGEAVDVSQTSAGGSIATTQRAWVLPSQVADLAGGSGLGYEMAYRFRYAPSQAQLRDDMGRLQGGLPAGAVNGSLNYLAMRDAYNVTNQFLLVLLLAFGVIALVASLATIVNLVMGTVLASYREIGISKALGFTPLQVVVSIVVSMAIPALAGCVAGIPAGAALSIPLIKQAARGLDLPLDAAVSPLADLLALTGILACVVVAATLPALRAGRMSAVEAIAAGGAPRSPRAWRPSRVQRLRLPRPLSLGAGDAFIRPLRGVLTVLAVLVGVATIVVASGLREALPKSLSTTSGLNGDVSVSRGNTVSDNGVMAILNGQPQTQQVVAATQGAVVVPGLADPVDGLAFRDDPRGLGWSASLVRGRWLSGRPGEVLLRRSVLDQAKLNVGSTFDGVIAGRQLRLHVVGETASLNFGALLGWSTLIAAEPDAQPDRYLVQLRPGSNANSFAAAVQAQEPDFLTVTANRRVASDSSSDAINTIMAILVVVLGLIAAVGVFSTMLLHVRERSRDIAIMKAVGMSPRQLLVMVMTSSAVLGVTGGLLGMPAGVRTYHGLVTQLARGIGLSPPPFAFDVLHPVTLYPLGLAGLAIALAGAFLPARRAARSRTAEILRSE